MSSSRGEFRIATVLVTAVAVVTCAVCVSPGAVAHVLEDAARRLRSLSVNKQKRKSVRVYMDGCFDLAHFGHANALRQAKACGDVLVVGLVPDAEVLRCKGPPVLREAERRAVIESVKWVDEIIENVPYDLTPEFCNTLYRKHGIDFIVHGDDPCLLPDGTDAYDSPKKQGKFKMIKRTEGVSTTAIVDAILYAARFGEKENKSDENASTTQELTQEVTAKPSSENRFLTTTRRVTQFSGGGKAVPENAHVVYVHGAFDLFNAGHVHLLEKAKAFGDYLLVGIWDDADVRSQEGEGHPVLKCQERALGVLACRHVDDIILGAPTRVTKDLLATFDVKVVVAEAMEGSIEKDAVDDPNKVAKNMGIFRTVEAPEAGSAGALTPSEIIKRVDENRAAYESRNERKNKSEAKYYAQKAERTIEVARET
ncbi:adenylyltransferase/cytidyltransferase family protein [bacterium]|nr:adenylyltransferase/cytidyltransferase family protein [bacterium]|tara:strand:- start:17142 stop:18416 length:1275 start_codon:yes stop_codon:yes gene_type:complete